MIIMINDYLNFAYENKTDLKFNIISLIKPSYFDKIYLLMNVMVSCKYLLLITCI